MLPWGPKNSNATYQQLMLFICPQIYLQGPTSYKNALEIPNRTKWTPMYPLTENCKRPQLHCTELPDLPKIPLMSPKDPNKPKIESKNGPLKTYSTNEE